MKSIAVGLHNIPEAGPAWNHYWQLRKIEFVDRKRWSLPSSDTFEFDWYDRPGARWIIVFDGDVCLGGARILSTCAPSYGNESYMLKDAQNGLISGIPISLLPETLPENPKVFEATRFFVDPDLPPKTIMKVQKEIVQRSMAAALELGGDTLIALMPCKIYRLFRRYGFDVVEHHSSAEIDGIPHSVGWLRKK